MRRVPTLVAGLATVLACAMAGSPAGGTTPAAADPEPDHGRHQRPLHSSDGVVGPVAPQLAPYARGPVTRRAPASWQVAPGVRFSSWEQVDRRGPVRASLLTVRWNQPGVRLDYVNPGSVSATAPVRRMLKHDGAVAGVNGDFFDIGDTGAPLGIGRARGGGMLHATGDSWNSAFYLGKRGVPQIGELPMTARIKQRPRWTVTNVNSPSVRPGGIGLYTRQWGRTSGYRVTDGQRHRVRMVLVRKGRVVRTRKKLPGGTRINGQLLIGRGKGATRLGRLKKGSRVTIGRRLHGSPRMAITGNRFLVLDGVVQAVDDREMHPRTAVGIDRDTREVLLLVVDGRQSSSRGYTMVELARMMVSLGADEALNLDGGGSSTIVGRRPSGRLKVLNSPSDGRQRYLANAISVRYEPR